MLLLSFNRNILCRMSILRRFFMWFSCSMMTNPKACFSKHSQWPPKSFRLRRAWELVLLQSFLGWLRVCLLCNKLQDFFFLFFFFFFLILLFIFVFALRVCYMFLFGDFFFSSFINFKWPMMIIRKACFSKHSQWPPKSFRLRQAWELVLL